MAFNVTVAGIDELKEYDLVTDVCIERRIYDHSHARLTFKWDEGGQYSERQTAALAAKILNSTVDVQWKGNDLSEGTNCFHGYVEHVSGERTPFFSYLTLDCVSMSKRADLVPRYRAFQATTLQAICSQISSGEPIIKIEKSDDLNFDIPLSLQYGETDYAYVSRMMHAWGIPMSVSDKTGQVSLGARGTVASDQFPGVDFRWKKISFGGASSFYSKLQNSGSGASNQARGQVGQLHGQLKNTAADYFPIPDSQPIRERWSTEQSQVCTSYYRLLLHGTVLPFNPGDVVKFEDQDMLIRQVHIFGDPEVATAHQEFELQPYTLPFYPEREVPKWPSRLLWAFVTANEKDPKQAGRVQVKFELEWSPPGDPQSSSDRAWLHLLTPYGGGKSPSDGKAGEYNGFYSVPEIGERVLVEFIGEWDSEAVVIGTVREHAVNPMFDPADTKRWRTPSGNEVTLTTKGSKEVVRIRVKDKIFFESNMDGANAEVYITPGQSDANLIHFKMGGGPSALTVLCDGNITMIAQQALHLEGQQVQITASGGNVNIDGAPNVMINCVPIPATPFQKQLFQEDLLSTSDKPRKLPTPPVATAATGGAPASSSSPPDDQPPDKKLTWIAIQLKDDNGKPVPNEKYRLKLANGNIIEGNLDSEGKARVDGIDPGGCEVSYPDRVGNEWKKV